MSPACECNYCHFKVKTANQPASQKQMEAMAQARKRHDREVTTLARTTTSRGHAMTGWTSHEKTPDTRPFRSRHVIVV